MKLRYSHTFFLMFVMAIVFVYTIGMLRPQPLSSVILKEKFWADKVHSKKKYDVLFAGDSRIYRGVDPKSVSEELGGLEVINFGFSSGGYNDVMFNEINNRLKMNNETSIIVLGLTPYSLTPKAQENQHFNQEKNRDIKEVLNRRFINPALNFFDPIKPTDLIHANKAPKGYQERFRSHGWVESRKTPFNPKAALPIYVKDFKDNLVSKDVLESLYGQIKLWQQQGIEVLAFRMPTTLEMETLENAISGYDEKEIKKRIEEAEGKWIEIKDRYHYSSYDGSHLIDTSAREFSRYLGKQINKNLKTN